MTMQRISAPLLICLAISMLSACSHLPNQTPTETKSEVQAPKSPADFLQAARLASEPQKSQQYLQAAHLYAQENNPRGGLSALSQIDATQLSTEENRDRLLLGAQLCNDDGDGDCALKFLEQAKPPIFENAPLTVQQRLSELRATAYFLRGDGLLSSMERIFAANLYSNDAYWRNHQKIWAGLAMTPEAELRHALAQAREPELQGWLTLALIMRTPGLSVDDQLQALRDWQSQWPQHPAARQLPEELALLNSLNQNRPQQIALALPLSGNLAPAGIAIRDGFLAAYYADGHREQNSTQIRIYDSNQYPDFLQLYQSLVSSGTQLVIGPLEKDKVNRLMQADLIPVPVLALNYSDSSVADNQPVYQIGLAIEDEIQQSLQTAWNQGYRGAAVIVPDTAWGSRALQAYRDGWQKLGGNILNITTLRADSDYSQLISELVATDESQNRAQYLSRFLGQNFQFEPHSRQDIDCIFMAAPPVAARQIKPLLAFHYAGDVPVLATSQVYAGAPNADRDSDLNGIRFVDLPWILAPINTLKDEMLRQWPEQANDRLYALGVDAYMLSPRLEMMRRFGETRLQGMTGTLTLRADHHIQRDLDWAEFKGGVPKLLSTAPIANQ